MYLPNTNKIVFISPLQSITVWLFFEVSLINNVKIAGVSGVSNLYKPCSLSCPPLVRNWSGVEVESFAKFIDQKGFMSLLQLIRTVEVCGTNK